MAGLKIKVILGKDIRLFRYNPMDKNIYEQLLNFVPKVFDLTDYQMVYEDSEGDKITIFDVNDFNDAVASAQTEKRKSLKIYIRTKQSQNIQNENNENEKEKETKNNDPNESKNDENAPKFDGCKDFPKVIAELLKQFNIQENDSKKAEEFIKNMLNRQNLQSWQNSPFAAFMHQPAHHNDNNNNNNNNNNNDNENDDHNNNNNNNHNYGNWNDWNNYNWNDWKNWKDWNNWKGWNHWEDWHRHCNGSAGFSAEFVKSITMPDGSCYPKDTILTKIWKLRNIGNESWGDSVFLTFFKGNQSLTLEQKYPVQNDVKPGEAINVSAMIKTPNTEGRYVCYFRLKKNGKFFGPRMWCDIYVINDIEIDEEENKDNKNNKELKKKKRELNKDFDVKQLKFDKKNERFERKQCKLKNQTLKLNEKLIKTNEEILKMEEIKNNDIDINNDNNDEPIKNTPKCNKKTEESLLKKKNKLKEKLNKTESKLKEIEEKQKNFLEKENEKEIKRNKKIEKKKRKERKKRI